MSAERMRILTPAEGHIDVDVSDPYERSLVGSYWNAVQHRLDTGTDDLLHGYAGVTIAGYPLEVDGFAIDRWAKQGEIDFEDIYAS